MWVCVGVCGCEWKKEAKKGWIQVFTSPFPRHTPVTNTDDKCQWLVTSHRTRMDTTQWTVVCSQQHNSRGDNFAQHRRQASFLMHRLEKEIWEWRSFFSLSHRWHAPSTGWRMAKTSGRHVTHFSAALTSRSCWSSRQHFRSHVQAAPRCGRDKSSAQEEVRVPILGSAARNFLSLYPKHKHVHNLVIGLFLFLCSGNARACSCTNRHWLPISHLSLWIFHRVKASLYFLQTAKVARTK